MTNYDGFGANGAAYNKPEKNCRTCTDFQTWSKQQRQIFNKATPEKAPASTATEPSRDDCPLDKNKLGGYTWGLLHTIAALYPEKPTDSEKKDTRSFFDILSRIYPCEYCAKDFQEDFQQNPINVDSQSELSQWLCNFHNRVNKKLGKPMFDCANVDQRWRDGWLDGSCD